MEYISAEEFLKQPKEVQKIFLEWWLKNKKPYDLFFDIVTTLDDELKLKETLEYVKTHGYYTVPVNQIRCIGAYPAFRENQLRRFIEDKTGEMVIAAVTFGGDRFVETEDELYLSHRREEVMDKDLLMAYWKYACRLVKEEIEESRVNEAMKQSFINNIHGILTKESLNE